MGTRGSSRRLTGALIGAVLVLAAVGLGFALERFAPPPNWGQPELVGPSPREQFSAQAADFLESFDLIVTDQTMPGLTGVELVRRLRRKGKFCILPDSVLTSPRRYLNIGILNAWILNQIIIAAYYLGIPPERLACWYRREKGHFGN